MIVFEVLTQSRQEKSEFTEFQEILAVFVLSLGLVFGEMDGTVYSLEKSKCFIAQQGWVYLGFSAKITIWTIDAASFYDSKSKA